MIGKRHNLHFRKLLVGYDGSPQSEKAVDIAFSLAERLDATVLIFAVARPPEPFGSARTIRNLQDDARFRLGANFEIRALSCDGCALGRNEGRDVQP
jgi:hypothetical protein